MKKHQKDIRAYTLVEIVVVALLLALLSSFAFMLSSQSAKSSEQIAIKQKLSNLASSLMRKFRKDVRSATTISLIESKLELTVHSFSKSGVPKKESIAYIGKDAIICRKTSYETTYYDFSSIMGKGSSFTFNIFLNKKKSSASIIINVKSSTGKYLLKVNESV